MLPSTPRVSVIIPTYNRATLLREAISSVLTQTEQSIELIIIDDGSVDDTQAVVNAFSDDRIRYYYQRQSGRCAARNTGIRASNGEFCALLDSDDLWYPDKLRKQLDLIERSPDIGAVYCDYDLLDDVTGERRPHGRLFPMPSDELMRVLITDGNIISGSASAILFRKSLIARSGYFDEDLHAYEDLDLWVRFACLCRFARVPEVLVTIRTHPQQTQRDMRLMVRNAQLYVAKIKRTFSKSDPVLARAGMQRIVWQDIFSPAIQRKDFYVLTTGLRDYASLDLFGAFRLGGKAAVRILSRVLRPIGILNIVTRRLFWLMAAFVYRRLLPERVRCWYRARKTHASEPPN